MTVQYGTGPTFQAQCPAFPPAPAGYGPWEVDVNGPIPADVQAHAIALANDMSKPLGYTDIIYSGGVPLLVRVDAHPWSTDHSGNIITGCFHGADVWVPTLQAQGPVLATTQTSSPVVGGWLFVGSLALGTVVSALSIYEFLQRRKQRHHDHHD